LRVAVGAAVWTIPGSRMKNGDAHEVPLPPLALDILKSLPRFQGGISRSAALAVGGRSAASRSTSSGSTRRCCAPTAVRWARPRTTAPCAGLSDSRMAKTKEPRNGREQAFCPACAGPLMARDGDDTLEYALVDSNRRPQRHRL
jgi:hypothetical protein